MTHPKIPLTNIVLLPVCIAILAVSACSSGDLGPTHDVAWFKAHPKILRTTIKKCESNPGKYKLEQNCINANKAQFNKTMTQQDTLPNPPANWKAKGSDGKTYE